MKLRARWSKLPTRIKAQLILYKALAGLLICAGMGAALKEFLTSRLVNLDTPANVVFLYNAVPVLPFVALGGWLFWRVIRNEVAKIEDRQPHCNRCDKPLSLESPAVVASHRCPHCREILWPELEAGPPGTLNFGEFLSGWQRRKYIQNIGAWCAFAAIASVYGVTLAAAGSRPTRGFVIVVAAGLGVASFAIIFSLFQCVGLLRKCPHCQGRFEFRYAPYLCASRNCVHCGQGIFARPAERGAGAIPRSKFMRASQELHTNLLRAIVAVTAVFAGGMTLGVLTVTLVELMSNWRGSMTQLKDLRNWTMPLLAAFALSPLGVHLWLWQRRVASGEWPLKCPHCRKSMREWCVVAATLNCSNCGRTALFEDR